MKFTTITTLAMATTLAMMLSLVRPAHGGPVAVAARTTGTTDLVVRDDEILAYLYSDYQCTPTLAYGVKRGDRHVNGCYDDFKAHNLVGIYFLVSGKFYKGGENTPDGGGCKEGGSNQIPTRTCTRFNGVARITGITLG